METIDAKLVRERKERESRKEWLTQIVAASARYERLSVNSDFIALLKDLENVATEHDSQIKNYLAVLTSTSSIFKRFRIMEVIGQHQLQKELVEKALTYPQNIITAAKEATKDLAKIKADEELEEANNG